VAARTGRLDLYVVRHAFAAHADPARWPDDSTRPLTEDGIRRFRRAARGFRRLVPDVDLVLSSGFARAWQTAELLHEEAGWPEPRECPALEAGKPARSVLDELRGQTVSSLAVVGHEPQLSRLASLACTGSEDALPLELKKGAVVLLSCEGSLEPGSAYLRWAVAPKILRRLDCDAD
jgi:phosphohistidine phosphatase